MSEITRRPLVLVESPYHHRLPAGITMHEAYLELCLRDAIDRGECPIATHKLYTKCLDDRTVLDRKIGTNMLLSLLLSTEYHAVYYDLGISPGMKWGIDIARKNNKTIKYRSLYGHPPPGV